MGLFIPENSLRNLKLYKYSSEDHSLLSKYVLKKWWNSFVLLVPSWMAPNVVTLLGLVFIICNLICVLYYDPYLNQESPRWCYFFYAFGLFMYQTFDGCDGAHARNTGQSGPLGELFDHSIDAINTTLAVIIFSSVFRLGYGWLLLCAHFTSVSNFYCSTWEEYHTHTLFLSQFSGPVEGILMLVMIYIFTGIFGPDVYDIKVFDLNLVFLDGPHEVTLKTVLIIFGVISLVFNIASALFNVQEKYRKVTSGEKEAQEQARKAYNGLLPFVFFYASVGILVLVYPEILLDLALPFICSVGLAVSNSVGRIILSHLTKQTFPYDQHLMFVPTIQLVLITFLVRVYNYDYSKVLPSVCWLGVGVALGFHGMFIADIVRDITGYLDIYALSIKHKKA